MKDILEFILRDAGNFFGTLALLFVIGWIGANWLERFRLVQINKK